MLKYAEISTISLVQHDLRKVFQAALDAYDAAEFLKSAEMLRTLLEKNPHDPLANNLLGLCFLNLNRPDSAEILFEKAIAITADANFYVNLGLALGKLGKQEVAQIAYRKAIEIDDLCWTAHKNLANIHYRNQRYLEAADSYKKVFRLNPESRLDAILLADCLLQTQQDDAAFEVYRTLGAWGYLQFEMRKRCRWQDLSSIDAAHIGDMTGGASSILPPPFQILQMSGATAQLQKDTAYRFGIQELPELQAQPICPPRRIEAGYRRLRIGYLSSDFFDHATMHLLAGVFEAHDCDNFDISVFCYSPKRDEYSQRLRAAGVSFVDIARMSDQAAAHEIHAREIDILVDLKGYTATARVGVTAMRPAPVIVNWLGYPGTMGHPRLADYIIGDAVVTPPEHARFYSERLALMPFSYQPNDRLRPLREAPGRAALGLPEEGLIFCSFNQTVKFNPQMFSLWGKLLLCVPNSILWLSDPQSISTRTNLLDEFRARGIPESRVAFAPRLTQADHLARLRIADLALDTFPYNSHTTASDALWAGVPLVTLKGETFASRVAASLLTAHGFIDLIAETEDQYFELALELATNSYRRNALKGRLHQVRMTSPLFDTVRFTRDLEILYRLIADDHGTPPERRAPFVAAVNAPARPVELPG